MKTIIMVILMFSSGIVFTQTKGELSDRFDKKRESEHFVLQWNAGQSSEKEIDEAAAFAEEAYSKLSDLLGKENMPTVKLIMTFRGEGVDPETYKKSVPHVDGQGRIHLYRFDSGGYLGAVAHEMVHAVRVNTLPRWERFFEEGLASAIAYHLYPNTKAFARYGYPLDVVAGYWLVSGKGIPLETMRVQHNRLNLKCSFQTYVMREDFFNYLAETYGMKKLMAFAYAANVGHVDAYPEHWDKPFGELVSDWENDLRKRYHAYEGAEGLADEYFKNTPVRYSKACEAGIDY
ncbi:MAG: hypothetical protein HEP71_13910 [Roseivirga sp.]|nr:hypothetical protein [Roseivirga sp.]